MPATKPHATSSPWLMLSGLAAALSPWGKIPITGSDMTDMGGTDAEIPVGVEPLQGRMIPWGSCSTDSG